jgi:hypothetical protein
MLARRARTRGMPGWEAWRACPAGQVRGYTFQAGAGGRGAGEARARCAGAAAGRARAAAGPQRRFKRYRCAAVRPCDPSVVAILSLSFAYPECARSKVHYYSCWYKLDLYRKCCWVLKISAEFPAEGIPTFVLRALVQLVIAAQEKRSSLRSKRVRGHVSSCNSLKNNQRDLTLGNASQRLAAGHGPCGAAISG